MVVVHAISLMKDMIADVCMLILLDLEKVTGLTFLCFETSHGIDLTIYFELSLFGGIKI